MTTGTRSERNTSLQSTGCGNAQVGMTATVSWSGADSPRRHSENPFTKTWTSNSAPLFEWYYVNKLGARQFGGNGTYSSCGFGGSFSTDWFMDDNDTLNLQSKILSKIKGSDLNLAVSLAEGKETFAMIKNSSLSVWKAYRSFRRGNFSAGYRSLREGNLYGGRRIPRRPPRSLFTLETSSAWLSVRYGWQPLLNDIYAGLQYLQTRYAKAESDSYTKFRSSVSRTRTFSNRGAMPNSDSSLVNRYNVLVKVNTKYLSSFRDIAACGVVDPELVAWELLPYSFVVDWFLPVGTYLEDRAAIPRITSTFVFSKKWSAVWGNLTSSPLTPGYRLTGGFSGSKLTQGSFKRSIGSNWSVPLPSFRNPFNGPLKHAIDAVALWRQRIR